MKAQLKQYLTHNILHKCIHVSFNCLMFFLYLIYIHYREFGLTLQRQESEEVDSLREKWKHLSDTAEQVMN